ncbi:C40 family peptidase [Amycolatopsis sp. H20-H5]|uniref:C40 family peptidase n=1 Tax=Amycolatopsis sp. H20-H5 TaxID=3046309 RepID=UPI002DB8BEF7|nr:C40 family peptidase [Amycolatopsis sp. H20-H5]MEC3978361.1 C40 family peptidase [Amycolatopsis sp. H20-H5]
MQSQRVKRVVSGALAAFAVITLVTATQPAAIAAPAPQAPPAGGISEALAKYRELAAQAEQINEDLLKAQDDLTAKQAELDKAAADVNAAKDAGAKAAGTEETYRTEVDKFAGASFTSGVEMNKLSALLAGNTTQEFLERSSALDMLANDKYVALNNLSGAVQAAAAATGKATDAQNRATAARDASAKLKDDITGRQSSLSDQINQLKAANSALSILDKAAQRDKGGAAPNVKAPNAQAELAIDAALSKLGSSYVWGATGPGTFDCSGLMLWAYNKAGISLPRSSREQSTFGTPVSRDQLQPGDLVFYYSPVSHVGMYLGNGMMVHAPTSGDVVKISPLQSQYSGARRPS